MLSSVQACASVGQMVRRAPIQGPPSGKIIYMMDLPGQFASERGGKEAEASLHPDVHTRHLRYFITAAEEENFNRAAAKLHVAQPAISRRIRDLEQVVGAELFVRSEKKVHLTLAGKSLLADARQVIDDFSQAAARCRRIARNERDELRIGINDSALRHEELGESIREYRESFPDVSLKLELIAPLPLTAGITAGIVDGAFIYTRPKNEPLIKSVQVASDRFLLACSPTHRLAKRQSVRLNDLKDEEFLWLPRESAPKFHDQLLRSCKAGGLTPIIQQNILSESTRIQLVSKGLGVSFVTASFARSSSESVVFLAVDDLQLDLKLEFAWLEDNPSKHLLDFISVVRAHSTTTTQTQ